MADDGMLLNFELPADALALARTFKGGKWKDRLTARKSEEWGRKKAQERALASKHSIPQYQDIRTEDEELIIPGEQARKRLRVGENGESRLSGRPGPHISHKPVPRTDTKEVVSSLFTYNPTSSVPKDEPDPNTEDNVEPSNAPLRDELATFTNLGLSETLASHLLKKLEIKSPTAIQRKAISQLSQANVDAFIQAETGSGKTFAYLLPLLQQLTNLSSQMKASGQDFSRESGLFAMILAPTRELCKQISSVLDSLLPCCHWIVGGTVIGGEKKKSEKARLRKGVNVLVATPGRLVDHLDNTEVLDISRVRWLVLDEGDRLMELGFEQDIQKIVSMLNLRSRKVQEKATPGLPDRRTTILCSATLRSDVDQLRSIALKDAVSISADPMQGGGQQGANDASAFSAPAQLKQSYAVVPAKQRLVALIAMLRQSFKRKGSVMKCIVFMSCADSVDFHFEVLTRSRTDSDSKQETLSAAGESSDTILPTQPARSRADRIPQGNSISESRTQGLATAFSSKDNPVQSFRLHGSLQQAVRTSTLKAFATHNDPAVLICTDVASRGLDLPNVDFVVEYDPPFSKDEHLHRIGRTARAGRDGRAAIFLMPGCEEGYVDILKEGRPHRLTRHDADEMLQRGFSAMAGVVAEKGWEDRATEWQLDVERWALAHPKHLEQARRAFQSHIRAYATHVAAERACFDLKQLHLGHLAKAFALRDKPGSIAVPGLRPSQDGQKKARQTAANPTGKKRPQSNGQLDVAPGTDGQDARRKMQAKMKALGGASEFNLG